jgi:hypothetical protein
LVITGAETAGRAVLFKFAEIAADATVPLGGQAVRAAKIIIDLRGAAKSFERGDGILVNFPITDLPANDFSASLRIRAFAKEPPPGLPADLAIDYVSLDGQQQLDKFNVVEGANAAPANDAPQQSGDLGPLLRHTQQLSAAKAVHDPSGFGVAYVHQPTQTGWIVVQPPGEPARCEAWFTYSLDLSLTGPLESGALCLRCGKIRLGQHDCRER